jgi:hypothetical protein
MKHQNPCICGRNEGELCLEFRDTKDTGMWVNWRGIANMLGVPTEGLSDKEIKQLFKEWKLPDSF